MPGNGFRPWLALLAPLCGACSLSAGPAFTRPTSSGSSISVGPSVEGALQLPRDYRTLAGIEWTNPGTPNDSWRLGFFYGYTTLQTATGRLGWEFTARGGLLGATNDASTGGFGGGRVAMLLRLGELPQPWQADSAFAATSLIVADVGVNGLARSGKSLEGEISSRLMLRLHLSSALLP